jgi:hypothetical protein
MSLAKVRASSREKRTSASARSVEAAARVIRVRMFLPQSTKKGEILVGSVSRLFNENSAKGSYFT